MAVHSAPAHAACSNPAGVSGETRFNEDFNMLQYCDDTNWIPMYFNDYWANGVTFDGSTTELSHATAPAGVSNGKKFTASFWLRRSAGFGATQSFFNMSGNEFRINFNASDQLSIAVRNLSALTALNARTTVAISDTNWHHVMMSFDMNNNTLRHLYLDGAPVLHINAYSDSVLNFTPGDLRLGADYFGTDFNGDVADFWIDFGTYIELSDAANRAKFIDARGKPVSLGADGSRVLGFAPDIFLSGNTGSWHTNKGTGGGFTENGALTDATSPSGDITTGLAAHWKLDETSGTTAADSTGNGHNGTWTDNPVAASGLINGGLSFNGGSNHVASGYTLSSYPITLCAWVKYNDATGFFSPFVHTSGAAPFMLHVMNSPGNADNIDLYNNNGSTWSASDTVRADTWFHVCGMIDSNNTGSIYINGVLRAGPTNLGSPGGFPVAVRLGGNTTYGLNGTLDDVRIYNRILTAQEVAQLAGCTNPFGVVGVMRYNDDDDVMQFCDGRHWLAMGPAGDGGAGCTNPPGVAGEMVYNTTFRTMQYCEGDDWIAIGKRCAGVSCGGSDTEKVVFIAGAGTATGGIATLDAQCQSIADGSGLQGTYLPWFATSDPNTAPAVRFTHATVPYVMTNGAQVADNWADLTDGTIDNVIDIAPYGQEIITSLSAVVTNVDTDGTQHGTAASDTCTDWTINASGSVWTGDDRYGTGSNAHYWTSRSGYGCSNGKLLYCFEQ